MIMHVKSGRKGFGTNTGYRLEQVERQVGLATHPESDQVTSQQDTRSHPKKLNIGLMTISESIALYASIPELQSMLDRAKQVQDWSSVAIIAAALERRTREENRNHERTHMPKL